MPAFTTEMQRVLQAQLLRQRKAGAAASEIARTQRAIDRINLALASVTEQRTAIARRLGKPMAAE